MLTRLKVQGFKNLLDSEVWFGPVTCIAGANGVGKSNLFDAIAFLSALAEKPLVEAALSVRDDRGRTGDVRSLFHHVGNAYSEEIAFEAEMIVPRSGADDLGQPAHASSTFLRYGVAIRYREADATRTVGSLELVREELAYIKRGDIPDHLHFQTSPAWRESAIRGARWVPSYISTKDGVIRVHQDKGSGGRMRSLPAATLPRTALSVANAAESPTATMARREMQSWRLLQLEPSALRQPDEFSAPARLANSGVHLPATLYRLARQNSGDGPEGAVYGDVANSLAALIDDVRSVSIDRDEKRELLTLYVKGRDRTQHPARALSDGTLRFLALSTLAIDSDTQGVLCLEEPENGIHPERIPAMIRLLESIATDVNEPLGSGNVLRQVIINTHSPLVVAQVPDDSLLLAETVENSSAGKEYRSLTLRCLDHTWRSDAALMPTVARGKILAYLSPVLPGETPDPGSSRKHRQRVVDRSDLQPYLPFDEKTA